MSNSAKSRIVLWIFILGLCFLSFMAGRAKADTYQVASPYVGFEPTFDLPHGMQFIVGDEYNIVANWLGGTLGGTIYVADAQLDGVMQLNQQILSYPTDYVFNPNLYAFEQWPFDVWAYMPAGVDLAHPFIVTPEPSSGIFTIFGMTMIGLLGMLGWAKRLERLESETRQ